MQAVHPLANAGFIANLIHPTWLGLLSFYAARLGSIYYIVPVLPDISIPAIDGDPLRSAPATRSVRSSVLCRCWAVQAPPAGQPSETVSASECPAQLTGLRPFTVLVSRRRLGLRLDSALVSARSSPYIFAWTGMGFAGRCRTGSRSCPRRSCLDLINGGEQGLGRYPHPIANWANQAAAAASRGFCQSAYRRRGRRRIGRPTFKGGHRIGLVDWSAGRAMIGRRSSPPSTDEDIGSPIGDTRHFWAASIRDRRRSSAV